MSKINREIIQLISRHSNWSESDVSKALLDNVYADSASWYRFLKLFFITLGVSFTTTGILFFFAYNWMDLHKFIKIGLIEALLIGTTLIAVFFKLNQTIKNILLSAAAMFVGVSYAVFGQVYQTNADAYDFFLAWTFFVTIWAVVSHFAPLWIIYIALINFTLFLYAEQVAYHWNEVFLITIIFWVNSLFLILFIGLPQLTHIKKSPQWFTNILALVVVAIATFSLSNGIFEKNPPSFYVLLISAPLLYGLGIWYGLKARRLFYLSIVPFSVIIILSALFVDHSNDAGMLFTIGFFIIISITLLIWSLIKIQKKWAN